MSIAADQTQSWLEQHAATELVGQNLGWLKQQRHTALERFEQVGLPGIRDEEWRYTNLRKLKSNAYQLAIATDSSVRIPDLKASSQPRLVFINGFYSEQHSDISDLSDDITFTSLALALQNNPELLETSFGKTLPETQHGFTALNTAFCQDGYVLHVPKGCMLEGNVEVLFVNTKQGNGNASVAHTRSVIIAEPNSQCAVVERHIGADGDVYLNNTVTEILTQENAHIDHYKIQQESNDAFHIGAVFIAQDANSHVKNHNIALTGLVTRNDISTDLNGQGAHIEMNGLVIGKGRQHVDNHTTVHHYVPNCTSDEYYKTILDDYARSVFKGRIIVAQDAQQTNADQQNHNLLLSKHAEADTKPQLEIYADDVKCSHGATIGQLDQKSMFYLRSRGINKEAAIALLTFAFANEVIGRIKVNAVREELTQLIAGQLLSETEG